LLLIVRSFSISPLLQTLLLYYDRLFISNIIMPVKKLDFLEADMSLLLSVKYIIVHEVFIVNIDPSGIRRLIERYVTKL